MLSTKYAEKTVGYAAVVLMVHPTESPEDLMTTVVSAIKQDLARHDDAAQCLALACIANMSGTTVAPQVASSVQRLLVAQDSHVCVKKKAALCLLRLFRTNPECVVHKEWAPRLSSLLEQRHLGVLMSVMSLVLGLASRSPSDYEGLCPYVIHNLHALVIGDTMTGKANRCRSDYYYYSTPAPWLQVKLLKFLQYYGVPSDKTQASTLNAVLGRIIASTGASESVNKSNADHALLFEAVNLIVHQGLASEEVLRTQALTLLGRFISVREPNIRYIGLQTMARLAQLEGNEAIKKHEATVLNNLKDADISVRRRALDLLFVMCDKNNTENIVKELVTYLETADAGIREEMVLKIAIVAEKYAEDLEWYVMTILQLIKIAGDEISDDIWHRLVIMVTNHKDLQTFASLKLFEAMNTPRCHETLVQVGSYILGEFGFLIAEEAGHSGEAQFALLLSHFYTSSVPTQCQMLTSFVKLGNLYEECRPLVSPIFEKLRRSPHVELQQRACEYLALPEQGEEMMEDVLREMPPWSTDRKSALEQRVRNQSTGTADANSWVKKDDGEKDKEAEEAQDDDKKDAPSKPAHSLKAAAKAVVVAVDLLDMSEPEPEHPPVPTPPPAAPQPTPDVTPTPPAAPAAAGVSVGVTAQSLPAMRAWFNELVLNPQGVLFEDASVQVSFRHAYQQYQARLAIYVKNKTSDLHLSNTLADIPAMTYLKLNTTQPLASNVAPGETASLVMNGECVEPFEGAPECVISFSTTNAQHRYPLRLPVVATCFMEPVALARDDFMNRWNSLGTPSADGMSREQQVVFPRAAGVITPQVVADIKSRILLGALHLGGTTGLDESNPLQVTCAGTFRTGAVGPNGQKVSVGCLVKVDVANDQWKLTVRAVHGKVAVALKNVIKAQLS
jgi:AP-2 complex subunit alpha